MITYVNNVKIILPLQELKALMIFFLQLYSYITTLNFTDNSISRNIKLRAQSSLIKKDSKPFFGKI